jgi:drug/metabolite transporter (DMT)-like permease
MTDPARPEVTREEVDVRRSPRVWRILALGAGLGAVVAFVLTFALPETEGFSRGQVFGFSLLLFVTLAGALAGLVVVLLDRLVGRRVVRRTAERTVARDDRPEEAVPPAEEDGTPAPDQR